MTTVPSRWVALALAGAALCACTTSLDPIAQGAVVSCGTADDCPSGWICHRDRCVPAGSVDATPPELEGDPALDHTRVRAGGTFTVSFTVSEPLAGAPAVSFATDEGEVAVPCAGGPAYACSYSATGDENGGEGGPITLALSMTDLAGNPRDLGHLARVELDFAPPAPKLASVAYEPGPGNPLPAVERATGGTIVLVLVSADEPVTRAGPGAPTLVARRAGAADLVFTLGADQPLHPNDVLFEAQVPGGQPDGEYALEVTWEDDLANRGPAAVPGRAVVVRTTPPTLQVAQDALVWVRSPQGNGAAETIGSYTIPAGPYFALEPSDPADGAATLPAGALLLGDGSTPAAVIVQSSADPETALVLGTLRPSGPGLFPRGPLVSPDLTTVHLVGVDDAGNRSDPVRIEHGEWVATTGAGAVGSSPHALTWAPVSNAARMPPASAMAVAGIEASGLDGQGVLAPTWLVWERLTFDVVRPPARAGHGLAFDPVRGKLLLFGGYASGSYLADVWEWDGRRWTDVTPAVPGPTPRRGAAMAYDPARGRVLLHGGFEMRSSVGLTPVCDTWEWDGSGWVDLGWCTGPWGPSVLMAFDSARERAVIKRGTMLRELQGSTLTTLQGAAPAGCAMAYDATRERVVLVGTSTWEWDGSQWVEFPSPATAPTCPGDGEMNDDDEAMTFDAARGRLVYVAGARAWERLGTTWTEITGSAIAGDAALVYDAARERPVLVAETGDLLDLAGLHWRTLTPTGLAPSVEGAMAFDRGRARSVFVGAGTTWEWNGAVWRNVTPATARPTSGVMAYDTAQGRVALMGAGRYWSWNGSSWTDHGLVAGGAAAGLTFDEPRHAAVTLASGHLWENPGTGWVDRGAAPGSGRLEYDGGRGVTMVIDEGAGSVREWNGTSWTGPISDYVMSRWGTSIAYDASRGKVVLFGGWSGVLGERPLNDLWEWTGTAWRGITPPRVGPAARDSAAAAFDVSRERLVLFGGTSSVIGNPHDTWELDCSTSRTPAVQLDVSAAAAGFAADAVTSLRVRAFAGGTHRSGAAEVPGAALYAWSAHVPGTGPGWAPLDQNGAGVAAAQPNLPDTTAAALSWSAPSPEAARRLFVAGERSLSFQVRPTGPAGADAAGAQVALDYLEVRIRYAAQ